MLAKLYIMRDMELALPYLNQHLKLVRLNRMSDCTTYRNITYRLIPGSQSKASKLSGQAGACRFVWNYFLGENQDQMNRHRVFPDNHPKPSTSFFSLGVEFTKLRKEIDWLNKYSANTTKYILKYQADAWKACFKSNSGFPKFKSRNGNDPSFTIPEKIKIKDGKLFIQKIGWLRIQRKGGNPYPDGKPVKVTITKKAGKWYAIVCYKVEVEPNNNPNTVGIDRNVRQVAVVDTDNNSNLYHMPDMAKKEARRKRYQRKMERQVKDSKRRYKTKLKLQKCSRHLKNTRNDWHHQTSREIANRAGLVVLEDLNTKGMTKSAKGTIDNPGKNVSQKSGLNREILKTGWSGLEQKLSYKAEVIKINPAYTSQACSACGHISKENRTSQAVFKCVACGHAENADINAARNILASGIGASARGGALSLDTPLIREKICEVA